MTPRRLATIAVLIGSVFATAPGRTQDASPASFPSRTVKLVVPAAGGSTTDTLARIMADQLARRWGKPVIVENISGGMVLGAAQVFRMAADGYTLMVAGEGRERPCGKERSPGRQRQRADRLCPGQSRHNDLWLARSRLDRAPLREPA